MYLLKFIRTCNSYYVKMLESTYKDTCTGFENYLLTACPETEQTEETEYKRLSVMLAYLCEYLKRLDDGAVETSDRTLYARELDLYIRLKDRFETLEKKLYPAGHIPKQGITGRQTVYTGAGHQRAKTKLLELVMRNLSKDLHFVTLTYKTEPKTFRDALHDIRLYARRMRTFDSSFRYIAVPELGKKSGRFHWHLIQICKAQISEADLNDIYWKCGFLTVSDFKKGREQKKNALKVVDYITKDFSKPVQNNILMNGRNRAYYISKGWKDDIFKCYLTFEQAQKIGDFIRRHGQSGAMDSYREHEIYFATSEHPTIVQTHSHKGTDILNGVAKKLDDSGCFMPSEVFSDTAGQALSSTTSVSTPKGIKPDYYSYSGVFSKADAKTFDSFLDDISTDCVYTNILHKGNESQTRRSRLFILKDIMTRAKYQTDDLGDLELISFALWSGMKRDTICDTLSKVYSTKDTAGIYTNFNIIEELEVNGVDVPSASSYLSDSLYLRL